MSREYQGALVVTRKQGDLTYMISENARPICVEIESLKGASKVRLGISAGKNCLIFREEVLERNFPKIYESIFEGDIVTSEMYNSLREQR